MKAYFPLLLAGLASAVMAETERQHGAHEHGAARLSVAADHQEVVIQLDSPAYNLFGFEHAPSTDAQHQIVDEGVARLKDASLWTLSRAAGCELEDVAIESVLLEGDHDHEHEEEHDHDHEHEEEHGHEEDHDHEEGSQHSDVEVAWHFHCDNPERLTTIEVGLFDVFSNLDDLDVQYLTETAQGGAELSPSRTTLNLE